MLEGILSSVKDQVVGQLMEKTGLGKSDMDKSIDLAGEVTFDKLKTEATSGNTENIQSIFKSKNVSDILSNPMVSSVAAGLIPQLVQKVGLSEENAKMVSGTSLPIIISNMKAMILGDDGKFDLSDVMRILSQTGNNPLDKLTGGLGNLFG